MSRKTQKLYQVSKNAQHMRKTFFIAERTESAEIESAVAADVQPGEVEVQSKYHGRVRVKPTRFKYKRYTRASDNDGPYLHVLLQFLYMSMSV